MADDEVHLDDTLPSYARQVKTDSNGQRHFESAKAHAAFVKFCEMGDARSVQGVARALSKSRTLMSRWANTWAWVERARLYDQKMQEATMAGQIVARREMVQRHSRVCMLAENIVVRELVRIEAELRDPDVKPPSQAFIARLFEIWTRQERLSRGSDVNQDQVAAINVTIGMQAVPRYISEATDRNLML